MKRNVQIQCEENFKTILGQRQLDLDEKKDISFLDRTFQHHTAHIKFNINGIKISTFFFPEGRWTDSKDHMKKQIQEESGNTAKKKFLALQILKPYCKTSLDKTGWSVERTWRKANGRNRPTKYT